jgi:hypothetical protein
MNSAIQGCLSDLIFKNAPIDGEKETHIEAKWDDFTLYDKKIRIEFTKYLLLWLKTPKDRRFNFYIFARKIVNITKHKKLFEKYEDAELDKLHKLINSDLEGADLDFFQKSDKNEYLDFIHSMTLVQADIRDLEMKIKGITKEYPDIDNIYLQYRNLKDNFPTLDKPEKIKGNLLEISGLKTIWIADSIINSEEEIKRVYPHHPPYVLHERKIISLYPFKEYNDLSNIVIKKTIKPISVDEWLSDEKRRPLLTWLLNRTMNKLCQLRGLYRLSKDDSVYYYPNSKRKKSLELPWKIKYRNSRRSISKRYFFSGLGPTYKHIAVEIKTTIIENKLNYLFLPRKVFTRDGISPETSERTKQFENEFRDPQFSRDSELFIEQYFWYYNLFKKPEIFSESFNKNERAQQIDFHTKKILKILGFTENNKFLELEINKTPNIKKKKGVKKTDERKIKKKTKKEGNITLDGFIKKEESD